MAGYWPIKFSFCVRFMNGDGVEVHKLAKKERSQYSTIVTKTSLVNKELIISSGEIFLAGQGG